MDWREEIGQTVRVLRKEQGETLLQVATKAGISRETLIAVEQGRANPTLKTLIGIARALHFEDSLWRVLNGLKVDKG